MASAIESQSQATWLLLPDYRVEVLHPRLVERAAVLKKALISGVAGYHDAGRKDFYDVELPTGWAYIHVHDHNKTVHLIAYSRQAQS
jgi:hypothetical protein